MEFQLPFWPCLEDCRNPKRHEYELYLAVEDNSTCDLGITDSPRKPNILMIMADDIGWFDVRQPAQFSFSWQLSFLHALRSP